MNELKPIDNASTTEPGIIKRIIEKIDIKRHIHLLKISPFVFILIMFVIIALFPALFTSHAPNLNDLTNRLKPPGYEEGGTTHLLGTDSLGRDVYSRIIYGASVSLYVAASSVILSGLVGGSLGIVAGYFRNSLGIIIMRLADIVLSIPFFLLAILTVAVLGPNLMNLVIVLCITRWPRYARVAYGKTLEIVNQDFVHAAKALGAMPRRVIRRHVAPEIMPPLVIVATLEVGIMIMYEAALSFLGLGIQPPNPSWGSMLTEGQSYITNGWWLAVIPGLCIFLVVVSVNIIGDYVRDVLDPKSS